MSNFIFIVGLGILLVSVYIYTNKKWSKREKEFDDFAYKMQKDYFDLCSNCSKLINESINTLKIFNDELKKEKQIFQIGENDEKA